MRHVIVLLALVTSAAGRAESKPPRFVIRLGALSNAQVQDAKAMSVFDTYGCRYIDGLVAEQPQNPTLFKVPGCTDAGQIKGICRGIIKCEKERAPTVYFHAECGTKSETTCPTEHECMRTSYFDSAGLSANGSIKASSGAKGSVNVNADTIYQQGTTGAEK